MRIKNATARTTLTMPDNSFPKNIGGFKIIDILGEGGMSVVYTALQEHPRRKVAIKVLRGGIYSPTAVRRFHQEVEILGKLDHPWIAKIYSAGSHDDGNGATPYYVMEHVEHARELTTYVEETELNQRDLLKLFAMISSAVEHGHHREIVHRDLKPGNILIDKNGEPKIIDFGVARSLDRTTVQETAMTEAGRLVGTVQFMAPEQVDAKITDIDARCDVYALGAVLYQMLTGRLPRTLEGLPIYEAVRQICKEAPIRPTTYNDTIDQNLEAIIMMALETNREKRYQSAGALGRDTLRYLGSRTIKARKASTLDHATLFCQRHKKQLLSWGVGLSICIGILFLVAYSQVESESMVNELQVEVAQLHKEKEVLQNEVKDSTETTSAETDISMEPILRLPYFPSKVVVSVNGQTIAGIMNDDYFASRINGQSIALPPINVDPEDALISLSNDGTKLAVISYSTCRLVLLEQRNPPIQISGAFAGTTAMIVGERAIAIAKGDMSLQLIGERNRARRATSVTGEYKAISFGSSLGQIIAGTDYWVYFWRIKDFPKNVRQLRGVPNPCLVAGANRRIVVVGKQGNIIIHEPDITQPTETSLQIEAELDFCALNSSATLLAYISNGRAYRYNIETQTISEALWIEEDPLGVAFSDDGALIMWTAEGKVFRE